MFKWLSVVTMLLLVNGCQVVGTGSSVLIRAENKADANTLFPNYVVSSTDATLDERMIGIPPRTNTNPNKYLRFRDDRYGQPKFEPAQLSVAIRDRATVPPFLPVEARKLLTDKIAALMTDDSKLSAEEKIRKQQLLEARLLNVPDLTPTTTLHHIDDDGRNVYYYYPRIQVEFASQLLSNSYLDRFSYLGFAIKLNSTGKGSLGDSVRFIDFTPKDADIVEFTRGTFSQQSQLAAKGTAGLNQAGSQTATLPIPEIPGASVVSALSGSTGLGGEISYTATEGYTAELRDAIERRSTAILENGAVFLSEFRSIREKRIAGTYSFDLMLEVPSVAEELSSEYYASEPVETALTADIYLVGVVRHVNKRGMKGVMTRVPEPENDHVYETVTLAVLENQRLWNFNNLPWIEPYVVQLPTINVAVVTNREDARFLVTEDVGGRSVLLKEGEGKKAAFAIDNDSSDPVRKRSFTVQFLPIVLQPAAGGAAVKLPAPKSHTFVIDTGSAHQELVVGDY